MSSEGNAETWFEEDARESLVEAPKGGPSAAAGGCPRCGAKADDWRRFCPGCGATLELDRPAGASAVPAALRPDLPARYEVLEMLGAGAMGQVWLCRDHDLDVPVAVKVLRRDVATNDNAIEVLRREARAAARLRQCHGILSLYEFDRRGETAYLVMEYAHGGTLAARLRRDRRLTEEECRRIGAGVARALAIAHERSVVHRDIKPSNVFLDAKGEVKIGDFGVAKLVADATGTHGTETAAGTPAYMAPEVIAGEKADGRADLYSLGCMLFEMATGQLPHKGSFPEMLAAKVARRDPPDPLRLQPALSRSFGAVVRRLLARDPADRFPGAADCAGALEKTEPPDDLTAAELERDTRIARVFLSEAVELQDRRMYAEAKARLLDALRVFRDRQAMRDPAVVPVLKLLARNYVAQGRYDRAEEFFRAALSLRREEIGTNHPEIAAELRYLGQILRQAGKFREAGNAYVEAWNIVRRSAGPKDPTLIRLLEHIATCHLRLGMRERARESLRKALTLAEESTGVSHAAVARILNSLASLALEEDDLSAAEVCLLRSLELLRARYRNRHGCAAEAMELYSVLLQKRGRAEESADWFRRGQEIRAERADWKSRGATG